MISFPFREIKRKTAYPDAICLAEVTVIHTDGTTDHDTRVHRSILYGSLQRLAAGVVNVDVNGSVLAQLGEEVVGLAVDDVRCSQASQQFGFLLAAA